MLQHLLGVEICDEERDIISLYGLPPEHEEGLGTLGQEAGELMDKYGLDLVGLLDLDADAHAVDGWLDEHTLVLVAGDGQGRQEHLRTCLGFDFGHVVALGRLAGKVREAERRGQGRPDGLEVWAEGL